MLGIIFTIVKLLIALCIVASIHEFGHFIFAKLFKTGVNEFSIGFGPKIYQKKYKETMYSLRWLPLGGYVSIEGEDAESTKENSFNNKSTLQKIIILLAGATFNAILAVIIFVSISMSYPTYNTQITELSENSVLAQAGIKESDVITKINGQKVNIIDDLLNQKYINEPVTEIEYIRGNEKNTVKLDNAVKDIGYIGVVFATNESGVTNQIDILDSGKVATKAGLKAGDKIVSVNNIETADATGVIQIIKQSANKQLELVVDRNGELITKTLTPDSKKQFDLGINSTQKQSTSIPLAWHKSCNNVATIVGSYIDLFRGNVKVTDMSGIVGIGEVVSKTNGLVEYLNLIGILSLAIGVANIMPFPPLDGGKIVIVFFEGVLRKKMSLKTEAIISYIGFGFLILLTVIVTYNDILRVF